ncbi:unnamed protein product [Euphydryas editha]|uniref:MADF domain-containing protein n=1 Tax=Euphydryas editha TaxID=104508 RepID=A0AAU9TQK1_EUPED|nr:unnamed protein product [Euphydryas editha]
MDEEKLILLVSNYPELYDLQNEHYMNSTRKNGIWLEIAKEIGVKDTVCKDKWKSLRDGFHRNIKKRKNKSGDPATKNKKWKFESQMQFLLPYLQERATKSNFEDPITSDDNTIPELEPVASPLSSTSTASTFKTITARKKNQIQKQNPSVASLPVARCIAAYHDGLLSLNGSSRGPALETLGTP